MATPLRAPVHSARSRLMIHYSATVTSKPTVGKPAPRPITKYDLILSSGFLAFAHHCGFLQAVEEVGLPVNGVMGTSAGALIGSMYAAGWTPRQILAEFYRAAPIERLQPHSRPWEGLLSMAPAIAELTGLLPATFAELQTDFACAVVDESRRRHLLVSSGSLPAAVCASAAIPVLFCPVPLAGLPGARFLDGGVSCRIGLDLWRRQRYGGDPAAAPPAVVHLIGRSSPFSGNDSTLGLAAQRATVVQTPKSGASLWRVGEYEAAFEAARRRALPVLQRLAEQEDQRVHGGGGLEAAEPPCSAA